MTGRTFEKGAKIERLERAIANPRDALAQIGALLVADSQQAFRDQKFGRRRWPGRAVPAIYGIIADAAQGRTPPSRRFEDRPALRDTGRLAASINFRVTRKDTVEVGSNLAYAATHQHGGPIQSERITDRVRRALWEWLKTQSAQRRQQLGWLLNRKFRGERLEGEVEARPFLGVTPQTRRDIRDLVGVTIAEA